MVNFMATAVFYSNKNFTMASEIKKICRDCRINVVNVCGVFELLEKYHQVNPSMIIFDCSSINLDNDFLGKIMNDEVSKDKIDIFYVKNDEDIISNNNFEIINLSEFNDLLHSQLDLINFLSKKKYENNNDSVSIERASKFLMFLGFSPKHSGYAYLKEILGSLLSTGNSCGSLTNELYPSVAVKHNTCACNIERNIRNAITCAWSGYGKMTWKNYFLNLNRKNQRPSNREFILMCIDYLNNANADDILMLKSAEM